MKRIDFIFFDAGGGHRSAANALKAVVEQQQRPWEIRLVNLQEVLEPLDFFRNLTGIRTEDLYNQMLKKGFTIGSLPMLQILHGVIRAYHKPHVRLIAEFWRKSTPDLVVSLVPNFNRALYDALRQADANTPMVTILTDLADYHRTSGSRSRTSTSSAARSGRRSRRAPPATTTGGSIAPPA